VGIIWLLDYVFDVHDLNPRSGGMIKPQAGCIRVWLIWAPTPRLSRQLTAMHRGSFQSRSRLKRDWVSADVSQLINHGQRLQGVVAFWEGATHFHHRFMPFPEFRILNTTAALRTSPFFWQTRQDESSQARNHRTILPSLTRVNGYATLDAVSHHSLRIGT